MREFDNYTLSENIEYINIELLKGRTIKDIEVNDFGTTVDKIRRKLNKLGYKIVNNVYTLVNADKLKKSTKLNKVITTTANKELQSNYRSNALQQNYYGNVDINKLNELVDLLEPLKELLNKSALEENIINVKSNELKVIKVKDPKVRSIKVDAEVLKKWDTFTGENKIYSVMDLVNTALSEFVDRYSK